METGHADALVGEQRGGDKRGLLELAAAGGAGEQRGNSPHVMWPMAGASL